MKKKPEEVRNKMIVVRVNGREFDRLQVMLKKSTCQSLGEYIRKICLQQPIVVKYRNQSREEFLAELVLLKKELNAIGINLNQVVHRMHIIDQTSAVITWLETNQIVLKKIADNEEDIKSWMKKIYVLWSQE